MKFDNDLVLGKLRRWEEYLSSYRLPAWEQLPDFGLYMEQLVLLLTQYLEYLPPELKQTEPITAAAINNYVRTRLLPEPKKKRYYRLHIACLIMICTLKQSLRLSTLQRLLPEPMTEQNVRAVYTDYAARYGRCARYFMEQVRQVAASMLDKELTTELAVEDTEQMIVSAAILGGFTRLYAEKLLLLEGKTLADGGSIALFAAQDTQPERTAESGAKEERR